MPFLVFGLFDGQISRVVLQIMLDNTFGDVSFLVAFILVRVNVVHLAITALHEELRLVLGNLFAGQLLDNP